MAFKSTILALFALAATTSASTTTATVLLPNACVTKSAPTVTIIGQANGLTTYSYSCSGNGAVVSSVVGRASSIVASVERKASEIEASLERLLPTWIARDVDSTREKRANECFGLNALDACIPWVITQGASYWAVHMTASAVLAVNQVCTFGEGGVANGPATCTASGRLDPEFWGTGVGSHVETFAKTKVDKYFIRNTVVATTGGPAPTGAGANNAQSTGLAVSNSLPTGAVAMIAGAGGILAAALAL